MAKQVGATMLTGSMGEVSYYKSQSDYLARLKGGVSADRIASDPNFLLTRQNNSEFGRASQASKLLRSLLCNVIQKAKDSKCAARLTALMLKVVHDDTTNNRGSRTVTDGDLSQVEGFSFNVNAKLTSILTAAFTSSINRVTGALSISVPSFIPTNAINAPAGATHFKIVSAGVEADFNTGDAVVDVNDSGMLPLDGTATAVFNISNSVTANSTDPLFLIGGIQFYQEVNGTYYRLSGQGYESVDVIKVSQS